MACFRAAFRPASAGPEPAGLVADGASSSLQDGQRLAKPGLPGFSSNSSPQTAQTLMGKAMGSPLRNDQENNRRELTRNSYPSVAGKTPQGFPGAFLSI